MPRPSKSQHIMSKINDIVDVEISTTNLAELCSCSLPTILNFISSYPQRFKKISRGSYLILPESDSQNFQEHTISQQVVNEYPKPFIDPVLSYVAQEFDW